MKPIGWITLNRSIFNHWVFTDAEYFKSWVTLIALANTSDSPFKLGHELINVKRGQLAYSQRHLSSELNRPIKWVRSFLKLLEKDNMISLKIIGKGKQSSTLVTISKYSDFQLGDETLKVTQAKRKSTRKGNASDLVSDLQSNNDNKEKNDNNEKNIIYKEDSESVLQVYKLYPTSYIDENGKKKSTNKSLKHKMLIVSLFNDKGIEEGRKLYKTIERYVKECKNSNTYLKNFGTFLNQLPDYSEENVITLKTDNTTNKYQTPAVKGLAYQKIN